MRCLNPNPGAGMPPSERQRGCAAVCGRARGPCACTLCMLAWWAPSPTWGRRRDALPGCAPGQVFNWDNQLPGVYVLLSNLTGYQNSTFTGPVRAIFSHCRPWDCRQVGKSMLQLLSMHAPPQVRSSLIYFMDVWLQRCLAKSCWAAQHAVTLHHACRQRHFWAGGWMRAMAWRARLHSRRGLARRARCATRPTRRCWPGCTAGAAAAGPASCSAGQSSRSVPQSMRCNRTLSLALPCPAEPLESALIRSASMASCCVGYITRVGSSQFRPSKDAPSRAEAGAHSSSR